MTATRAYLYGIGTGLVVAFAIFWFAAWFLTRNWDNDLDEPDDEPRYLIGVDPSTSGRDENATVLVRIDKDGVAHVTRVDP